MPNEALTKKYDITNDPNVEKFSKKLTRLIKRINKAGYKIWSSGYCANGLWITKLGLSEKFEPENDEYVDSDKALVQVVSADLVHDLDCDDCQLVEEPPATPNPV